MGITVDVDVGAVLLKGVRVCGGGVKVADGVGDPMAVGDGGCCVGLSVGGVIEISVITRGVSWVGKGLGEDVSQLLIIQVERSRSMMRVGVIVCFIKAVIIPGRIGSCFHLMRHQMRSPLDYI